jgi:Pentapeptide repeats (8 copies)
VTTTSSHRHAAQEFLKSSIDRRLRWLQEIGLLRYAKLLTQIEPSEGNIACVERFLSYPSQMKFPLLMGADLTDLKLDGVNFIRANLKDANLTRCCLRDADLIFGNFSQANLSAADLRGATLNETLWSEAIVTDCDFRGAIGLTLLQVRELRSRGGIFE